MEDKKSAVLPPELLRERPPDSAAFVLPPGIFVEQKLHVQRRHVLLFEAGQHLPPRRGLHGSKLPVQKSGKEASALFSRTEKKRRFSRDAGRKAPRLRAVRECTCSSWLPAVRNRAGGAGKHHQRGTAQKAPVSLKRKLARHIRPPCFRQGGARLHPLFPYRGAVAQQCGTACAARRKKRRNHGRIARRAFPVCVKQHKFRPPLFSRGKPPCVHRTGLIPSMGKAGGKKTPFACAGAQNKVTVQGMAALQKMAGKGGFPPRFFRQKSFAPSAQPTRNA